MEAKQWVKTHCQTLYGFRSVFPNTRLILNSYLIKLKQFDFEKLQEVKWIEPFDIEQAKKDREILLKDVLLGSDNSLYFAKKRI